MTFGFPLGLLALGALLPLAAAYFLRRRQKPKRKPAGGFGLIETLSGWGARYTEEKARRLDFVLSLS